MEKQLRPLENGKFEPGLGKAGGGVGGARAASCRRNWGIAVREGHSGGRGEFARLRPSRKKKKA